MGSPAAATEPAGQPEAPLPTPEPRSGARRAAGALGLAALAASAVFAGNPLGVRERVFGSETPEPRPAATGRVAGGPTAPTTLPPETVLRSQPWWQSVTTLEGAGPSPRAAVTIGEGALQWRVKWTCEKGHLSARLAGRPRPLIDAGCPGSGTAYATRTGRATLDLRADGPWKLQVDQQVDVPLVEPPLPAMSAPGTRVVATGSFYRIDQTGNGTMALYRMADGTHALRFDDFFVTANIDLQVKLSPLEAPRTTAEFMGAPSVLVAPLDVTAGSLNFTVPTDVGPSRYKSVVIWCPLINSAYAGATLTRPAPTP